LLAVTRTGLSRISQLLAATGHPLSTVAGIREAGSLTSEEPK